MAALAELGTKMRRGRFMDQLPEEEQQEIRIIISPEGEVRVEGGADPSESPETGGEEEAQDVATGAESEPGDERTLDTLRGRHGGRHMLNGTEDDEDPLA